MNNPVQEFFEEEPPLDGNPREILEALGRYGIRNLAYDGDIGCNPGYIFRGEAAFDYPLRSSLERGVYKKLGEQVPIHGETLKAEERHPNGKVSRDHPRKDVFWWLSLMQHDDRPTRLLDFTRDIRVALYFAIEQHFDNTDPERDLIIYCFPCKDPKYEVESRQQ